MHSGGVLLSNEWGDVGLETSDSDTHDDNTDGESCNSAAWVDNNWWNSGHDQDDVTDDGDEDGELNGHVATEILISDIGTEKWHNVRPEGVEGGESSGRTLSHVEGTRLSGETGAGVGSWRKRSLNEVDDYLSR